MIIFDLDGTLWNATVPIAESWNMLVKRETGRDEGLTPETIMSIQGLTMDVIADKLFGYLPPDERYALAHKCEVFENEYLVEVKSGALFDGVEETLAKLKDMGVKMAVVSNCQEGYIKAFLDSKDLWKYFVDYEEWGRTHLSKAENIRLVMDRNNEDRAIYVGDIQKDSDSAHAAGVPCIDAAYGFGDITDAEGTIEKFSDLPAVLKELGYL